MTYDNNMQMRFLSLIHIFFLSTDELGGTHTITKICALKPKLYAFQAVPICQSTQPQITMESVVCKGGKKSKLNYSMYETVLASTDPLRQSRKTFRSYNHEIYMIQTTKQVMSLLDDKRWWVDKYTSLPYGHPSTRAIQSPLLDHDYCLSPPPPLPEVVRILHDHDYSSN